MSVVLMILVGAAIQFYARDMNVRDMDIRQTQLAAAVMQMIEDDLRATLHNEPVDTSGLEALLAASAQQVSGGGQGGGGELAVTAKIFRPQELIRKKRRRPSRHRPWT